MMEKQLAQKTETIFYYEFHWEITPIPLGLWILAQFLASPRTALNEIRRGEREAFTVASQGKYMQHQHSTFCMMKSFVLLDMMMFSRFSHHVGSNYLTPADGRFLLSPNPHSTPSPCSYYNHNSTISMFLIALWATQLLCLLLSGFKYWFLKLYTTSAPLGPLSST